MPHARAKSLGHGLKNRDSINLNLNPGFESVNPASLISAQFKQFKLCFTSFIIYCFKLIELANLYRGRWWWWSKVIFVLNQILSCVEVSLSWGCDNKNVIQDNVRTLSVLRSQTLTGVYLCWNYRNPKVENSDLDYALCKRIFGTNKISGLKILGPKKISGLEKFLLLKK